MKKFFQRLRLFSFNLGLVEQAQIVASTAVVVIMATIISANIFLNQNIGFLEFVSILTVGIIGFASVYFSLKYGRQLEEQKRELVALNTVAQDVNRSIDLNYIFSNVLQTVTELMKVEYSWLYILEDGRLFLKNSRGVEFSFFTDTLFNNPPFIAWIDNIHTQKDPRSTFENFLHPKIATLGISAWVSVPLHIGDECAGLLLLASSNPRFFSEKRRIDLVSAFSNHISVALNNAHLFEKLRKSEQQYADLYEHSPDMYHLVNPNGIIVSCNQTEVQTLGYAKRELIGKPLAFLYPEKLHTYVSNVLRDAFTGGRELRGYEELMMKKDGSIIDVSINTSLVFDEKKSPVLMRCVVRDITEKKRLEEKIMQAQKIDSIGNLAGGVAHDFNNILTSILGAGSIMRRRISSKNKLYPFVEIIETAGNRGKSLTNQLLTFARRKKAEVHPLNIHTILEETLQLFEPSAAPAIVIARKYCSDSIIVKGDEGQLQQAFLNILINARDATHAEGTIVVETEVDSRSGDFINIKISDTGVGMSREVLQHIFEPFFSTKDQGKGTGLGLSVVYGVVKDHDGSISVQSNSGKGSVFTLSFPIAKHQEIPETQKSSSKIVGGTEKILVVDDEEYIRVTLGTMLRDLGYSVTAAESGKKALSILTKKKHFDLIILDMNMPEMSGKQLFEQLHKKKVTSKIVISSGYSDAILGKNSFARQVHGFLQKPYQVEELGKKIRDVLDAKQSHSRG